MSALFKKAEEYKVSLLISLSGPSGSGKTYSALRLATGLSKGERFAVIDTENGRAAHYAGAFKFDHCDLKPPFTPASFSDVISAADKGEYPVIVIDSMSHAWEGEGGILDIQEQIVSNRESRQNNYENKLKSRESYSMPAWRDAKKQHASILHNVLRAKANIIMCFRAKERLNIAFGSNGKEGTIVNGVEWLPITDSRAAYEFTMSFMMNNKSPGSFVVSKYQEQHRDIIKESKVLDEKMGESLRDWIDKPPVSVVKLSLAKEKNPASPPPAPNPSSVVIKGKSEEEKHESIMNYCANALDSFKPVNSEVDFKEEVRRIYKASVNAFNANDNSVTEQLRKQWYSLCYHSLLKIDGMSIKPETAKAMHKALALPEPLSIAKTEIDGTATVRIDYGGDYIVFLDELLTIGKK